MNRSRFPAAYQDLPLDQADRQQPARSANASPHGIELGPEDGTFGGLDKSSDCFLPRCRLLPAAGKAAQDALLHGAVRQRRLPATVDPTTAL